MPLSVTLSSSHRLNRLRLTLSLVVLLGACASSQATDLIDQVAQRLAQLQAEALEKKEYRVFPSGVYEPILLPSNAAPAEVAMKALKRDDWAASTNCSVLTTRVVTMSCGSEQLVGSDTNFVAVLLRTSLGDSVVLLRFMQDTSNRMPRFDHWWSRVYDPKRLLNHLTPRAALDAGMALCFHVNIQGWSANECGRWATSRV